MGLITLKPLRHVTNLRIFTYCSNLAIAYISFNRAQEAVSLLANKDFDYAISAHETAISESTRILGAEHKTTFITRYNHAVTYAEIEQIDKSIALLEQLKHS